jgi:Big-like domain-containing protein
MGKARSAAVAAIVSSLIFAGGSPALAAPGDPLVVTSTGLTEGQAVGAQTRIRPVWTEGATIAKVEVYLDGVLKYTTTSWADGLRLPAGTTPDGGALRVTVRAYDSTGAWSEASTDVVMDRTFPTASFSPVTGIPVSGVLTVTASNVSDDVARIALVAIDGTTIASATTAPWTITYDTTRGPGGVHIEVTDRADNTRPYTGYIFDNTAPTIGAPELYNGSNGRVKGFNQIHVPFSDSSGVNRDEWRVDGVLVQSHPAPADPASTYRYSGSILDYDFGTAPRTVTIQALAGDRAGNVATRTFTVVVDSAGPAVTGMSPGNGALVRGSRITSTIRASDPAGLLDAVLNNAYWANNPANLTVSIPAGADGRKNLTWAVHDRLYNTSTITRYVIVDNTRPTLKITSAPKNNAKVKGTVKVYASATDRNGVSRVELLIGGRVVAKDVTAGYSFSINTRKYAKTFRVQLRAYDRAGNLTSSAIRVWKR